MVICTHISSLFSTTTNQYSILWMSPSNCSPLLFLFGITGMFPSLALRNHYEEGGRGFGKHSSSHVTHVRYCQELAVQGWTMHAPSLFHSWNVYSEETSRKKRIDYKVEKGQFPIPALVIANIPVLKYWSYLFPKITLTTANNEHVFSIFSQCQLELPQTRSNQ